MRETRISRLGQIEIYVGKCFRMFLNEKGWKVLISAAIITLIISSVTGSDTFVVAQATRNGAFALVCACIWIGIFNSIQSICRERAIIKREHRTGLHISSYIIAHMIYELCICLMETVIVTVIIYFTNKDHFPTEGLFFVPFIELMITFFLIIYSSDVLGLLVSGIVKNENTAMTIMPFILIVQLVMSGMIFALEGASKVIANFTISKWGVNAICTTANVNSLAQALPTYKDDYDFSQPHLLKMWLILILFIFVYGILSIVVLEFVDKDKR